MEQKDVKIRDIFRKGNKLTFLVGAGCSVDAPSKVPNINTIKGELIEYFCIKSEIEKVLKIKDLNLESLLYAIYISIDEDLKIFDFFELFDKPNLQHFFLADCINKGHFLMTTNFDFLIENALLKLNIPHKEIIPVITEKDFINYSNPTDLFKRGFRTVYKIHCSSKNVITGADTSSSLIDSIKVLGFNKEGKSLFQIKPNMGTLLDSICIGRLLVILGYSGLNDFDILPTIKALKNVRKIIWINHSESTQLGNETIFDIKSDDNQSSLKIRSDLIKLVEKLREIHRMSNVDKIYLIDVNTVKVFEDLLQIKPKISSEINNFSLKEWFKENIKIPSLFEKVLITTRIFYESGLYNEAMKCSEGMIRFTILADVKSWKSMANKAIAKSYLYQQKNPEILNLHLNENKVKNQTEILTMRSKSLNIIANINYSMENFPEAIKSFEEEIEINTKLGYSKGIASSLNKIALISYIRKKYNQALKNCNKALKIYNQIGDLTSKADTFIIIGECFLAQMNYPKAKKSYLSALKIHREIGLLKGKNKILNKLGEITRIQKNYPKALKYTENALKLSDQLKDWTEKANSFKIIASIKKHQNFFHEEIKFYSRALKIYEKLGKISETANCLVAIGNVYQIQGNYTEALEQYFKALEFYQKIDDLNGKAICLYYIACIFFNLAKYQDALRYYEEMLNLNNKSINLTHKSISLKNIGIIHQLNGNFSKALSRFEEVIKIDEKLGNLNDQALNFYRIALINFDQKKYLDALAYFNKALHIYDQLGDLKGVALCLDCKGKLFRLQGNYNDALNQYNMSLKLYDELKDLSVKGECLINIGEVYKIQGKFSEALKTYMEALNINKNLGDSRGQAICLNSIGDIHREQGDYFKALKSCTNALKINGDDGDLSVKAKCHKCIAMIHQNQRSYPEALKHYKETLLIYKNLGIYEDSDISDIKNKIMTIFSSMQNSYIPQKEEALKPKETELQQKEKKKMVDKKSIFTTEIIDGVQVNYEKTLKFYENLLKNNEKTDDLHKRLQILDQIGKIYKIMGCHLKAVKNYEEALELAEDLGDRAIKFKIVSKIRALYNDIFK